MRQEHSSKVAELEGLVSAARAEERRHGAELVAPLQAEIRRLHTELDQQRMATEASASQVRLSGAVMREETAARAASLEATVERLKATHTATLDRVRAAHEGALSAERGARAEAEARLAALSHEQQHAALTPPRATETWAARQAAMAESSVEGLRASHASAVARLTGAHEALRAEREAEDAEAEARFEREVAARSAAEGRAAEARAAAEEMRARCEAAEAEATSERTAAQRAREAEEVAGRRAAQAEDGWRRAEAALAAARAAHEEAVASLRGELSTAMRHAAGQKALHDRAQAHATPASASPRPLRAWLSPTRPPRLNGHPPSPRAQAEARQAIAGELHAAQASIAQLQVAERAAAERCAQLQAAASRDGVEREAMALEISAQRESANQVRKQAAAAMGALEAKYAAHTRHTASQRDEIAASQRRSAAEVAPTRTERAESSDEPPSA